MSDQACVARFGCSAHIPGLIARRGPTGCAGAGEPAQQRAAVARGPVRLVRHPQPRCHLHQPPVACRAILPFEHYVSSESGLPPRHRALLILRTAWLTRSEYLWAHRVGAARQAGVTSDELKRIAQGPGASGWDAFDASLLRAADELHVDSFVSDATWQALSARYNTNQLVDVVDTVGTLTMQAGAINSLAVEIEATSRSGSQRESRTPRPPSGRICDCSAESRAFPRSSRRTGRRSSESGSIPKAPVSAPPTSS